MGWGSLGLGRLLGLDGLGGCGGLLEVGSKFDDVNLVVGGNVLLDGRVG